MASRAKLIVILLAVLSAGLSPATGGTVLCTTPSGHFAIEPAHEGRSCPAAERAPHGEEQGNQKPCHDIVLGGHLATHRNERTSLQAPALSAEAIIAAWCVPAFAVDLPGVAMGIADYLAPPPLCPDRLGLSTVILVL